MKLWAGALLPVSGRENINMTERLVRQSWVKRHPRLTRAGLVGGGVAVVGTITASVAYLFSGGGVDGRLVGIDTSTPSQTSNSAPATCDINALCGPIEIEVTRKVEVTREVGVPQTVEVTRELPCIPTITLTPRPGRTERVTRTPRETIRATKTPKQEVTRTRPPTQVGLVKPPELSFGTRFAYRVEAGRNRAFQARRAR